MKFIGDTLKLIIVVAAFLTIQTNRVSAETTENKPCTMASVYIEEGNKLIQSNPAKAEVLYREALERCPESVNASFDLGLSLYGQKKNAEAVKVFDGILGKHPNRTDALRMLAYIIVKENIDLEKGMTLAEKILASDPKDEGARKILMIALTEPSPALSPSPPDKIVAKKQPPPVAQPEGSRQIQKGRLEETIAPLLKDGREAYKKGDMDAAILSFRKVLNIEPENREAREYLGKTDAKKVKAAVDKEIEKRYLDGVGSYIDGKYREAIGSWKRVLELDPKYEKASLNIEKAKRKMEGVMDTR